MPEQRPSWADVQKRLLRFQENIPATALQRPVLRVDTRQQQLWQLFPSDEVTGYPVSTSRHGTGQQQGSLQTPLGIHCVAEKIGAGAAPGSIFRGRENSGEICQIQTDVDAESSEVDLITSRILWLQGLQPGYNRGGDVDSYQRYIYIHGTADEARIGQVASIGCIRMKNSDVIALFDRVEPGDLVIID